MLLLLFQWASLFASWNISTPYYLWLRIQMNELLHAELQIEHIVWIRTSTARSLIFYLQVTWNTSDPKVNCVELSQFQCYIRYCSAYLKYGLLVFIEFIEFQCYELQVHFKNHSTFSHEYFISHLFAYIYIYIYIDYANYFELPQEFQF